MSKHKKIKPLTKKAEKNLAKFLDAIFSGNRDAALTLRRNGTSKLRGA